MVKITDSLNLSPLSDAWHFTLHFEKKREKEKTRKTLKAPDHYLMVGMLAGQVIGSNLGESWPGFFSRSI